MRSRLGMEIARLKGSIEKLEGESESVYKQLEEVNERKTTINDDNAKQESEIADLVDDNKLIEGELRRLGSKTASKFSEMQGKLSQGIDELEGQKKRQTEEQSRLRQQATDKVKRVEDDLKLKMQLLGDRLSKAIVERQNAETELNRLQDARKRAEIEFEQKLKQVKA